MTEKLKRCPFCGHEAVIDIEPEEIREPDDELIYRAVCEWCCGSSGWYASPEEATKAWNSRV